MGWYDIDYRTVWRPRPMMRGRKLREDELAVPPARTRYQRIETKFFVCLSALAAAAIAGLFRC